MASKIDKILKAARAGAAISFADLCALCDHYFGEHRYRGSHRTYRAPRASYPVVTIQPDGNKAKAYQVRQVLKAIEESTP